MDIILNNTEVRVISALVEKEITTPEYYPLSLNALTNACNQKTNREPVVSYDESTVMEALDTLIEKDLIIVVKGRDSRVTKYDNYLADKLSLSPQEVAVICILMLRGAQTVGEIRTRTERLYDFADLAEVETTLDGLVVREDGPFVVKLPRQPGHKESRYMHLISGEVDITNLDMAKTISETNDNPRIAQLEEEVESLRQEMQELRQQFSEFKQQFE